MARIKKFAGDIPQGLSSIDTFLIDENPNSDYFRITEFKETFTGGKNGFLIEGSEFLKETTEVKIEILDVEGNTIYYEPGDGIPEYYEGVSKVVSVYIYEDTPIGLGKITILGELKKYIDSGGVVRDVPEEWKGLYNLKWEREFKINKNLTNEDKVRFYRRPQVAITEIARPIFTANPISVTQTGNVLGTPLVPSQGTNMNQFPRPSEYLLTTLDDTRWTGSVVNNTVTIDGTTELQALEVVSDTELIVSTPYTEDNIVTSFNSKPYSTTFNYIQNEEGLGTALSGSFGKFIITNLETFVGDVHRIKVFRTSQADLTDFQFVQEIVLESTEVLIDYESSQRDEESYGLFTPYVLTNYWTTSSNDITTEFNQSYLFNSVKLDSTGENTFHTINNVSVSSGIEYTLSFNTRIQNVSSDNSIVVYLQGTKNGVQKTQTIGTINSSNELLQKTSQTFNFIGDDFDDSKLYFKVTGDDWYVSTISLRAAQETSFSPDEITFIQTVPRTLEQETFDFRFEFYDINNNYIPVTVTATKTFTAGNLNEIQKDIQIVPTSLYFQFDSGSQQGNALPPKAIFFDINKEFLTGSTNFTSGAYDNDNNLLSASEYSATFYPGLLEEISTDRYRLTVENFSGSIYDNVVQYITYTAECEGVTDNVTISRLADGKGGVNFDIRPFRGTLIRNSNPSSSVEIQSVRIDGINETNLRAGLPLDYSIPTLYVTSASLEGDVSYITLSEASSSGFIRGLTAGLTGSGEINYNAEFNRDAIDGQRTVYLIPSTSTSPSESILTSLTLTDLQDGLNRGVIKYNVDTFAINPYVSFTNQSLNRTFTPATASVTGSFFRRGETQGAISGTLEIYPSMSINSDYNPEFWLYYITGAFDNDVTFSVSDENDNLITPHNVGSGLFDGSTRDTHKQLSVTFTYNEPFTTASVSIEETFTIVPEGKPGDDNIAIEVDPSTVILQADETRIVTDYSPTITSIRVKQGNTDDGYLTYQETKQPGTFYINESDINAVNITFEGIDSSEGGTTLVTSEASSMTDAIGTKTAKIVYPIEIRPFFTSSYFTSSFSQSIQRLDEPPASRGLTLTSDTSTVTYNGDGNVIEPSGDITLTATAFNTSGSGNINFYFFKDDNFIDIVNQNSTTVTKAVPSSEFPAGGTIQTYRVELHDGNNDAAATPQAIASTTIQGVQDGVTNYQSVVTNQNATMFVDVYENKVMDNTSTTIEAYKGQDQLTHKGSGESYSLPTFDDLGNVIPNAEFRVSVHSFPSDYIDISGSLVSGSLLPTDADGNAYLGPLDDWTNFRNADGTPNSASAQIVLRVDFEDGRDSTLVRQNLSVGYEGNVGPGLIMRGEWTGSIDYIFDVAAKRRDSVFREISDDVHYWATTVDLVAAGGGGQPYTYEPQLPPGSPPYEQGYIDNTTGWQYLGQEDFFVAAKLAIFEESFVKNTINVGNNPGSEFANIVIAGGRTDPYIAIGQNGTIGVDTDQTSTGVIGYNRPGTFMGTYDDSGTKTPRFSLVNTGATKYLTWDSDNLEIAATNFSLDAAGNVEVRGTIRVTGGDAATTASLDAVSSSLLDYVNTTSASLEGFAEAVGADVSASSTAVAEALTYALANGTLTGTDSTFISEKFIFSPVIAGEEGVFSGKISISGTSGSATPGTMFFGNNVQGTNAGIYINSNNYWYNNGQFSVGGVGGAFTFDGASGSINLNDTFLVDSLGNISANSGSFRGTVSTNSGNLGSWVIGDGTLTSENGRITLEATGSEQSSIKVRNENLVTKVNLNADSTLPSPGAGTSVNIGSSGSPIVTTQTGSGVFTSIASFAQNTIRQEIGSFTVGAANGGNYDIVVHTDREQINYGGKATASGNGTFTYISSTIRLREGSPTGTSVGNFSIGTATAVGQDGLNEYLEIVDIIFPYERQLTQTVSLTGGTTYYLVIEDYWNISTGGPSGQPFGTWYAEADFHWSVYMEGNLSRVGTTINDGGFQIVRSANEFLRFNAGASATSFPVGDINGSSTKSVRTDLSGSLGADMIYLPDNELPNNNFTGTPTKSGYIRLPNNVVIQFGYSSTGQSSERTTVTFPLTFTRVYTATYHTNRSDRGSQGANHIHILGTSSMQCVTDESNGSGWWTAIGIIE